MAYLIDTNIAIHARDGDDRVLNRIAVHEGAVVMSALSLAELQRGLFKHSAHAPLRGARMEVLLRHIPILPFDSRAAESYGRIIAQCGWVKGRDYDRMIAAHAIVTGSILVTDHAADFSDITGLAMENWLRE